MKKVFNYLRSMRFGLLLLVLIAACSVAGTVIPQGREIAWYAQNYQSFHGTILLLGLNRVFESWYFIVLLVLLCLNLSLCSLLRIRSVVKASKGETERAAGLPDAVRLSPEGVEKLRELAWTDLDRAMLLAFTMCIEELVRENKNVCKDSREARDFIARELGEPVEEIPQQEE